MKLESIVLMSTLLISTNAFAGSGPDSTNTAETSLFQLQDSTAIPSGDLKPGSYSIRIVDHLADRFLIEIRSSSGKAQDKFLAVPVRDFATPVAAGPIIATGPKGHSALRGFSFSKGRVVEFVYPKNAAVGLAKANNITVLAVDPASEGMPSTSSMNSDDLKIVTLWMLTPTAVGPNDSAAQIQAVKYTAPASALTERAAVRPPVVGRLPKTASYIPLMALIGIFSAGLAVFLRFWRLRTDAA